MLRPRRVFLMYDTGHETLYSYIRNSALQDRGEQRPLRDGPKRPGPQESRVEDLVECYPALVGAGGVCPCNSPAAIGVCVHKRPHGGLATCQELRPRYGDVLI